MTFALSHFRRNDVRAFWAGLLLLAYLFRALMPIGFMPDTKALEQGIFKIVICTGHGAANLLVGSDGQPAQPHTGEQQKAKGETCPYSLGSVTAFIATIPLLAVSFIFAFETYAGFQKSLFIEHRHSPAQSRAPPV